MTVKEDRNPVLLVVPFWPNKTWFSGAHAVDVSSPLHFPLRRDLLSQGKDMIWHPRPDLWNLHVWFFGRAWTGASLPLAAIAANHNTVEGRSVGKK